MKTATVIGIIGILLSPAFLRAQSQNSTPLTDLGWKLNGEGKLDEAIAAYSRAIQLDPRHALAHGNITSPLLKKGRNDEVIAHATKALDLGMKHEGIYENRGEAYRRKEKHELAIADFNIGIHLNPKNAGLYVLRGMCYEALSKHDLARKDYLAASKLDAKHKDLVQRVNERVYILVERFAPDKGIGKDGWIDIPVPTSGLLYHDAKVQVRDARNHKQIRQDDNDVLLVLPEPNRQFEVTVTVRVKPYNFHSQIAKSKKDRIPKEVLTYLGKSWHTDPASPGVDELAKTLHGKSTVGTVQNIAEWEKKNIRYHFDPKKPEQSDFKSVTDILKRGTAECNGIASLFVALCRNSGIPCRKVWGMVVDHQKPGYLSSHNWAEFWVGGVGWVPIDPGAPQTLGNLPNEYVRFHHDEVERPTPPPYQLGISAHLWLKEGLGLRFQSAQ